MAQQPEPGQHEKARRRSDEEPAFYDVHRPGPHPSSLRRGKSCAAMSTAVCIKRDTFEIKSLRCRGKT